MNIEFTKTVVLEVVEGVVGDEPTGVKHDEFKAGEVHDVEIIDGATTDTADLQFGDGSVAHGVYRNHFKVLPE